MIGALFLGVPVVLTLALLTMPSRARSFWLWCLAICALFHAGLLAYGEWQITSTLDVRRFLEFAFFVVVIPWLTVAIVLLLSPDPRYRMIVSIPLPFIWAGTAFGSYLLGLTLGILSI